MQTKEIIERALARVDAHKSKFPGMTYEQGVDEALQWVLGDLLDDEFPYAGAQAHNG